jgi:hypothetical protein
MIGPFKRTAAETVELIEALSKTSKSQEKVKFEESDDSPLPLEECGTYEEVAEKATGYFETVKERKERKSREKRKKKKRRRRQKRQPDPPDWETYLKEQLEDRTGTGRPPVPPRGCPTFSSGEDEQPPIPHTKDINNEDDWENEEKWV